MLCGEGAAEGFEALGYVSGVGVQRGGLEASGVRGLGLRP